MTEDEAKTKICCGPPMMVGLASAVAAAMAKRDIPDELKSMCRGSRCMAWRWADPSNPYPEDRAQWGGYCGLAGRPS